MNFRELKNKKLIVSVEENRLLSVQDFCLASDLNRLTESMEIGDDRWRISVQLDVTSSEPLLIKDLLTLLEGRDCVLEGPPIRTSAMHKVGDGSLLLEVILDQGNVRDLDGDLLPLYRYDTDYGFARNDQECVAGHDH